MPCGIPFLNRRFKKRRDVDVKTSSSTNVEVTTEKYLEYSGQSTAHLGHKHGDVKKGVETDVVDRSTRWLPSANERWEAAYAKLGQENPTLVRKYEDLVWKGLRNLDDGSFTSTTQQDREELPYEIEKRCNSQKSKCEQWPQRLRRASMVIKNICDLINVAVKVSPEASIIWAGISVALPLMNNLMTASTEQSDGFVYICGLIKYYSDINSFLAEQRTLPFTADRIATEMDRLSFLVVDYQIRSVIRLLQSSAKTYAEDALAMTDWNAKTNEIKGQVARLDKLVDQDRSLTISEQIIGQREALDSVLPKLDQQISLASQSLQVEREQFQHTMNTEAQSCIRTFGPAEYLETKQSIETASPGTCKWVRENTKYHAWLEGDIKFLFVSAGPGCGKSVLTRRIVDDLIQDHLRFNACYFFFKDGVRNSVQEALRSLIHQLISRNPSLVRHAMEAYRSNGAAVATLTETMRGILLSILKDPESKEVVIVIDALDECKADDLHMFFRQMANIVGRLGPRTSSLRLLMTGRPYSVVREGVRWLQRRTESAEISSDDDPEALSGEISLVLERNVETFSQKHSINAAATTHLRNSLLSMEHRTYLWLYLVMDHLEAAARKKKFKLTPRGLEAAVRELPKTVEEAYEGLLERSSDIKMARKLLFILLAAERVLTVGELNEAIYVQAESSTRDDLDLEPDDKFCDCIREWCGLFVSIQGGKAYFIHQTAREFLLAPANVPADGPTDQPRFQHSLPIEEAHKTLFCCCSWYLSLDEMRVHGEKMKKVISDFDWGRSNARDVYQHLVPKTVPPSDYRFMDYASSFWDLHLRQADNSDLISSEVVRRKKGFISIRIAPYRKTKNRDFYAFEFYPARDVRLPRSHRALEQCSDLH
ncbi:hypothetical protein GGS20DRAFT_541510 [Poronia punctata]|nr:hypothetical protein GGS20DRAFT_541510 [Poronia punctata]